MGNYGLHMPERCRWSRLHEQFEIVGCDVEQWRDWSERLGVEYEAIDSTEYRHRGSSESECSLAVGYVDAFGMDRFAEISEFEVAYSSEEIIRAAISKIQELFSE
jgi:hypothetical protein